MTALPDGWGLVPLGELLTVQPNGKVIQQGWSPKCHDFPAVDGEWAVLKTTAIQAGRFVPEHNKQLPSTLIPKPNIEVRVGDLLITCAGPRSRCGVPALVRHSPTQLMMSGKMYRLRPDERLDSRFLEFWLLSPEAQRLIDAMKTGISDSGLNLTHGRFVQLPVPLPTLEEQHRIVELLEDHISRLAAAVDSVRVSLHRLDVLRQLLVREIATGEVVPLKHLAVDSGYGTSVKCEIGAGGPAVVRIPNLVGGRVDLVDEKRAIDTTVDLSSAMLEPGDVLIIRTNGSKELIGRSGVVQEGVVAAFASYLIRYKVDTRRLRPEWLHTMLGSPALRAEIERLAASSAGQHNLSLGKLDGLQIPTPGLDEQDVALARLAELDDQFGALRAALAATLRRGENLRRALLAAAFSGDLRARARPTA